jgi:GNAT superfamily N-acetyltransferase
MLSRIRLYTQVYGVRGLLAALGRRLRKPFYVNQHFIILLKPLDSVVESRKAGDLKVEDLEEKHLPALSELNRRRGRPRIDRRFATNVASGHHGFVAWRGDQLIGYYWWVDRDAPVPHPDLRDLDLGIELEQDDVYGTDFFLLEEFRGAGTAAEFLCKVEKSLRGRGYHRLWGYVDSGNRAAIWTYRSRGYEPMWVLKRRRWLWFWQKDRSAYMTKGSADGHR